MSSNTYLQFLLFTLVISARPWIVKQPKENLWVTLAKSLKQDSLCLSMESATNPMSTCLVGITRQPHDYPFAGKRPNPVDSWDNWMRILPHAPEEPQEFDLLGSSKATYCVRFGYMVTTPEWLENIAGFHSRMSIWSIKFIMLPTGTIISNVQIQQTSQSSPQ